MQRWIWVGACLALSVTGVVRAQDGSEAAPRVDEELDQAARLTFNSAREAFSRGEYELALERFEQAYRLSPRPVLLYNIGVTLDRLRRDEDAVARFREYLERVPDAPDREEVEARIRVLDRGIAERQAEEAARAAAAATTPDPEPIVVTPPPTEPPRSSGLHPAIALTVAGAAVVAGGLVLWSGLDAVSRNDDYEAYVARDDAVRGQGQSLYDDVRSAEVRTNVLIGVAGGLAAAAVVLAIFSDWSFGSGSTTASFGVGPRAAHAGVTHRF
ncbi:MAG: tetratricopeptide repeat protein [Myxococcales bacterium]|nr:tetratricopeptide repeat protein [Myxococcales bacterium]